MQETRNKQKAACILIFALIAVVLFAWPVMSKVYDGYFGNIFTKGDADVTRNATVGGTLTVTGISTLTSPVLNTSVSGTAVLDENDMASDSDTQLATQQSIKAYVDSGAVTMTNKTLTSPVLNTSVSGTAVLDENDMASDSDTQLATQQSIKAYVDSGAVTMTNKTLTSPVLNTGVSGTAVLDENDMASDSDTQLATQQSIKAYVDIGAVTMTNKTLTSPVLNTGVSGTAVLDENDMASDSDTQLATQQSIKAYVDSGAVTMTNKTLTSPVLNTGVSGTAVLDENDMASDSDTQLATQQSIKAYVDSGAVTMTNKTLTSPAVTTGSYSGDQTLAYDTTGGQAGAKSQWIGLPAIKLVSLGTMVNGTTETVCYVDDTPDGEWAEIDSGTNITVTADETYYRAGSKSLKIAFADTAVAGDGATNDITNDDLGSNESVGFWIYSDTSLTAGDMQLVLDDTDGTDQTYSIGAVSAGVWTWIELDVSGCDGNCDTTDKITVLLTSQGETNLGAFNVYFDLMYKWDEDNEEALGVDLVSDGIISVVSIATGQDQANTPADLAEGTDFITNYQTGNDVIVVVTDQSAASGIALVAYQ
ncbi:MAG: hypothetical protein PHG61_00795 [Candidatus Marinimicrobia bacterium]|nr:hypothetical protein [Candidatus Neomarinimicrobiota bacterium]